MNLKQEITNHLEWIDTMASLLGSEDIAEEKLQLIIQHDQCLLGQWLGSDDSAGYKQLPEFDKLIESHDAFHKLAGNLITALQQGKETEALESQAQFIEMSKKVISYIKILQSHTSTQ